MSLSDVFIYLEAVTEVVSRVPSPIQPFATLGLQIEKIVGAAIRAQAASQGKTVEEVIAGLHEIKRVE
jgi:hypothetical protein